MSPACLFVQEWMYAVDVPGGAVVLSNILLLEFTLVFGCLFDASKFRTFVSYAYTGRNMRRNRQTVQVTIAVRSAEAVFLVVRRDYILAVCLLWFFVPCS